MLNGQDNDDVLLHKVLKGLSGFRGLRGSNYPVLHSKVSIRLNGQVQGFIYY